jgi:hypothetical protein
MALKLGVSVLLLSILFSRVDLGAFWTRARDASLVWLLLALVAHFAHPREHVAMATPARCPARARS